MITFTPLSYLSFSIQGKLNSLQIGPLPDGNGIINTDMLMVNAPLPGLGAATDPNISGPGGGQYVEILIDDKPESSRIFTQVPFTIKLTEGTHMLHFILSSGDGECVKDAGYAISRVVHIIKKDIPGLVDNTPMIIYNLPRKLHRANNVVLDFALVNVPLDPLTSGGLLRMRDHQVSVRIGGTEVGRLDAANAHLVSGLMPQSAAHEITLVLVDRATGQELPQGNHPYAHSKLRKMFIRDTFAT